MIQPHALLLRRACVFLLLSCPLWAASKPKPSTPPPAAPPPAAAKEQPRSQMLEVKAPAFTVYTDASPEIALSWAREFELYRVTVQALCGVNDEQLLPLNVLAFSKQAAFQRFVALSSGSQAAQVMQIDSAAMKHLPVIALALEQLNGLAYLRLRIAATSWIMESGEPPLDPWAREGLGVMFSTLKLDGDNSILGQSVPEVTAQLAKLQLIPTATLLSYNDADFATMGTSGVANQFGLQAWATVRELTVGDDRWRGIKALEDYQLRLARHATRGEAFKEAFGLTPEEMDERLQKFITAPPSKGVTVFAAPPPLDIIFDIHPSPPGASDLYIGEMMLQGGKKGPAPTYLAAAHKALPDDVRVAEIDWLKAAGENDAPAAMAALDRAITLGTRNFRLRQFQSAVLFDKAGKNMVGFDGDPEAAQAAASAIMAFLELKPNYVAGYEQLAFLTPSLAPGDKSVQRWLSRGLEGPLKDDPLTQLGFAAWQWRAGDLDAAKKTLLRVVVLTNDGPGQAARGYRDWLDVQIEAARSLAEVRKWIDTGRVRIAAKTFMAIPGQQVTSRTLRADLVSLSKEVRVLVTLDEAQTAYEDKKQEYALSLLDKADELESPEPVKKKIAALRAEIAAKRVP